MQTVTGTIELEKYVVNPSNLKTEVSMALDSAVTLRADVFPLTQLIKKLYGRVITPMLQR